MIFLPITFITPVISHHSFFSTPEKTSPPPLIKQIDSPARQPIFAGVFERPSRRRLDPGVGNVSVRGGARDPVTTTWGDVEMWQHLRPHPFLWAHQRRADYENYSVRGKETGKNRPKDIVGTKVQGFFFKATSVIWVFFLYVYKIIRQEGLVWASLKGWDVNLNKINIYLV